MQKMITLAFTLAVIGFSAPASAYTQQQQTACQNDAFRLCGNAIPDEQRVRACLRANMQRLSPSCHRMFQQGRRRSRHR